MLGSLGIRGSGRFLKMKAFFRFLFRIADLTENTQRCYEISSLVLSYTVEAADTVMCSFWV